MNNNKKFLEEERERLRGLRDQFDDKLADINALDIPDNVPQIDPDKEEHLFYFAYGSNMDEERLKSRGVKIYGKCGGLLKKYKLIFNKAGKNKGEGYANIIKDKDLEVEGVIYETDVESIESLDKWEGFPKQYDKELVIAENKEQIPKNSFLLQEEGAHKKIECVVYIANPQMTLEGLKPTKEYMYHLLKGKYFLSQSYINFLESIEAIN